MNGIDLQCCLCKNDFIIASQPRMMCSCEHNACTPCLKLLLAQNTTNTLVCQHCGH